MEAIEIISQFYDPDSKAHHFLVHHGKVVACKALSIARRLDDHSLDFSFIEEAALLHDIGIIRTYAPQLGCFGYDPYIAHGAHGREMLESIGMHRHALVCERHVGMGLTVEDIRAGALPIPVRDMTPKTMEERIICFADKFYSKIAHNLEHEKPIRQVRDIIRGYGEEKLQLFDEWCILFKEAV